MAVVRNIGPYMPLWPMKCSSTSSRPEALIRSIAWTKSSFDSIFSQRTSGEGCRVAASASFARRIVSAARANFGPPSR
jgi:hypothetical protein